ncbi:MAG: tetratricopeptide repeat protein [Sphingomonas sp.]|jgi:hypothetical protein
MTARLLASLHALSAEEVRERLSAPAEERAAFIRSAAEAGVAEAQAIYGQMLLDGDGVAGNPHGGFLWFNRAASAGHLMALNMVGRCYDLGWGVAADKTRAAECFRIAAERGLAWAMYNYATLLALGEGIAEDKAAALDWLRRAASSEEAGPRAKAMNFIGSFYEDGWVVARDMVRAANCYAQAAEDGDFRGQFNHARMLLANGDVDGARIWLARANQNCTAAFRDKARAWLADAGFPALATECFPC